MEVKALELADPVEQRCIRHIRENVLVEAPAVRVEQRACRRSGRNHKVRARIRLFIPDYARKPRSGGVDKRYQHRKEEASVNIGPDASADQPNRQ